MKIHRFYTGSELETKHDFWLHDQRLINQWSKVLRFKEGQQLVLFDGQGHDKLYKIAEINPKEAHLIYVTDFEPKRPAREVYLFWALLKKDKNDWVIQKCTELGVSHFVPLLADRSQKAGFNIERAQKIIIEAAEQCGRSDIPSVREPVNVQTALAEYKDNLDLYICEQASQDKVSLADKSGVLIGPEGGWSDNEKELFKSSNIKHLNLHDFTLRAETAAVAAATQLIQ